MRNDVNNNVISYHEKVLKNYEFCQYKYRKVYFIFSIDIIIVIVKRRSTLVKC